MRGKGESAVYRVPADKAKPLKHWTAAVELPPGPNGERRRKVIRRKNKAELLAELSNVRRDLEKRGDLPTKNQTVEQWFTYWLREIAAKRVRPNTLDGYRRSVENHIIPAIGKTKLDKVTAATIRRVHDAVLSKGLNSTTALLAHRTMSVSFKAAVREGRIGRNPTTLVDAPRKATTTLNALTLDESVQVLRHLANQPDGALWATILLTGARRGEIIGLERSRVTDVIDLSWQLIRIEKTDVDGVINAPSDYEYRHITGGLYWTRPKSSKGWRVIPLVEPLRSILRNHLDSTPENPWGLVFTRNGRPYGPDLAGKDWRKMLTAAGIDKNVRLHDGRHTTAELLYAAGVPEDLLIEILGHSTRVMSRSYKTRVDLERLRGAMQQLSDMVTMPPMAEGTPMSDGLRKLEK